MIILWGILSGLSVWLELVYHFSGYGFTLFNPIYAILLIAAWSGVETLLIGLSKGRMKKIIFYFAVWLPVVWTGVQLVYLRIFKQPLLWQAMIMGGEDALTVYWREAMTGIWKTLPFIILLMLPAISLPLLLRWYDWQLPQFTHLQVMRTLVIIVAGTASSVVVLEIGKIMHLEYYEEYHEFYDPLAVAENMGVLPLFHGDMAVQGRQLLAGMNRSDQDLAYVPVTATPAAVNENDDDVIVESSQASIEPNAAVDTSEIKVIQEVQEEPVVIRPQQFDIDYELLHQFADNKQQTWLADYIENEEPVNTNEYTGMFKGYNLIFLTAEGFSTYAINEELTPTLYRLANSGFVCNNYYVPLWYTSTSDGEYVNMTGLIPGQMHSMRHSADNDQPFVLPAFFAGEGVSSYAYHNNTLSYYDRHLSHPNMGYDFKACKLGDLDETVWGDKVFEMEQPNQWPASDYNMMVATVPEYVNEDRFHVYYMTVSGHMYYSFTGNSMSKKNKEFVEDLEMSENAKAYIACNIELDRAMEDLLNQLEAAGQLENTVICLSADHYPYSMSEKEYEELAGKDLSEGKDLYRNTLILWNAGMEEPVYIDKACYSLDLLPTLLNLFGFDYDSRMYVGQDILSDREGMVIFSNRDFLTDSVIFIEKGDITTWLQDEEGNDIVPDDEKDDYLAAARRRVKNCYNFSTYVLQENYYADVLQAIIP